MVVEHSVLPPKPKSEPGKKAKATAIEAYQLLGRAPTEPEDIPW